MNSRLPTADEINVFDSLDERDAVKHFLGKDLQQAQKLFSDAFHIYQEDLMFMGPKAFWFYVPAAINHLLSPESYTDDVNSFCSLIEHGLEYEPEKILAVAQIIREGILGILDSFDSFDGSNFDRVIYEDVLARYRILLSKLNPSLD